MVGVILVTHGTSGEALLEAAAHVLGAAQPNARAITVAPADDAAVVHERVRAGVAAVDDGSGVILFTDVYGATPSNIGARLLERGRVEGLAGVNLPMLVRALACRTLPLEQVLARAIEAGTRGQINMNEDPCHAAARGS